jgi:hypothetical protein
VRKYLVISLLAAVLAVGGRARATTIVVNDAASCATIGATEFVSGQCRFYGNDTLTVAAGDILQLGVGVTTGYLVVNGTIEMGSQLLWTFFDAVNNGTINVGAGGDLENMQGGFANNGTINVHCGGTVGGTISGNPPAVDACVPPDKSADTCEGKIVKAVGVLTVAITKCQAKLADSAFKGVPFDENACEALAKTKFDTTVAQLTSCPACALANASTFRAGAQAFVGASNHLAFCAGGTPLP